MKKLLLFLLLFFYSITKNYGQNMPEIGAQIWIEPGQSEAQIDNWFKTLADHQMPVCRLFMQWNFIETAPNKYDFTLYDFAFEAAKKYNIKVVATLAANHGAPHNDKYYFYKAQDGRIHQTTSQQKKAASYIKAVVTRYKDHSALSTWMLQNEPGQLPTTDELALKRFRNWLGEKYKNIDALNKVWFTAFKSFNEISYDKQWEASVAFNSPLPFLDWNTFWRNHLTWYLDWIATKIRKYDTKTPLHVNPHAIFEILPKYDLPAWRKFLQSVGASIHPSWHFGLLQRKQYAMGVSATCDILRGVSEPNPFWVTELQGGNNTYSGAKPLCPTEKDIAQWVWTSIGSGAERVIFWCLNYRAQAGEAAEWSLLDFQSRPSERIQTSANIAKTIGAESEFFKNAKPSKSGVYILLSPETMQIMARKSVFNDLEGRKQYAHMQAALAYYYTLTEIGIPAQFKQFDDFDFNQKNAVVIVPNAIALSSENVANLEKFAANGNKLIITGLTGFFDEKEKAVVTDKTWALEKLVGGRLKEVRLTKETGFDEINIGTGKQAVMLPTHLWIGEIEPLQTNTEVIGKYGKENPYPIATRYKNGGEVLWIPSMVDLGAWLSDNSGLAKLLQMELSGIKSTLPFTFEKQEKDVLMRYLENKNEYITIVVNSGEQVKTVQLKNNTSAKKAKVIYGGSSYSMDTDKNQLSIQANETIVVKWE
jgi:beta-galactosidase